MTPSKTSAIPPRTVQPSARRAGLLVGSALCGVAAMLAQPSQAQTLPGIPGAGNITVSTGGSQPAITAPNANTLDIDLNAPRTVINWASLHVSGADTMDFHFDANSDIVLNKTTSQILIDAGGTVTGKVGASTGGNVWFYSPQGVIVSPGAVMTAGGFLFSRGTGIVDAGFVDAADPLANLRAATDALIRINTISSATSASIDASGNVLLSASSGALNVGIAAGATVGVSTTSGSITASEVRANSGAASVTAGGPGATVTSITGATGVTVSSGSNTSVGSATTTTSGDIVLSSGGSVSLTLGNSARDTLLTAPLIFLSTLDAGRDAILTGTTGVTVTNRIFAGDDIELTASNGDITAGGAFLRSTGLGASDDAHILLRSDTGAVTATNTLQTQGTGTQAGDITVQAATTASAGTATATRDLKVTGVTASLINGSAARDVFVTATTGGVTVTTAATAGDDVEVTATTGAVSAGGATLKSTGVGAADDAHLLARSLGSTVSVGSAITQGTGAAAGDVIISAATTATLGSGVASRDLTISGVTASLTSGTAARDLFVTSTTGDATVVTSATAGDDVEILTTDGDVVAGGATLRSTGIGASNDAHILLTANNGSVDFGTAITEGTGVNLGKVTADAAGTITGTAAQASLDVSVTGAGDINLASATAGRFITVSSTGGAATLGAAEMTGTGAGHNLLVSASGDAILGAPDYSSITAVNTFSRTGGNTGTATVQSTTGDAKVYLDTAAAISTLQGVGVDVTIENGPATFGTLTALTNNVYVETLDGALTVGTATANAGDLDLYAYGGDLTLTGSAHGAGLVHLQADGLVDASAASLVSSDSDLELIGGAVSAGRITADGAIDVGAATGNAMVQKAEAGQTVQVVALNGDATLRGGEGPDGIAVIALNKATFGADDKASITAANYAITDASCGCGSGGLQVMSYDGDAVVNIDSASNGITLVAAAIDGDVTVVQKTGDLKIEELAAYNITLEAMAGTLETGFTTSSGGDYTVTAQDFLGDVLTPTLFTGDIHDVTITDTLGDLNLGTASIHADRRLTIVAQDGAVTGAAQLSAGSGLVNGRVDVTADAIAIDTASSNSAVLLDGGTGLVDVATSVSVDGNYSLSGGDFSANALTPVGLKTGSWFITDRAGGFDFSGKTLHYGGSLVLDVQGVVNGGDLTVDAGNILVTAQSGHLGKLTALNFAGADSSVGNIDVDSIAALSIQVRTLNGGTASLGAATLTGTGANTLVVESLAGGNAVLGAATPGAITAANVVTSAGATTTVTVSSATGRADVNLDHMTNANLNTLSGPLGVAVQVVNGPVGAGSASATGGQVSITGTNGGVTVVQLTAGGTSLVSGGGETRLVSANVTGGGGMTVRSTGAGVQLGDATPGRVIAVTNTLNLAAATGITEQGAIHAGALVANAGTGIVLLGDNQVAHLSGVNVAGGGFAYHGAAFDIAAPIVAVGQTVDLRSDGTIGQAPLGLITARKLTGSSVGGAIFDLANPIAELGDFTNTTGRLKLISSRDLTINGTVLSTGILSIASHGGMTIAGTGTIRANGAGDALVLASDGVFTNARGADAVTAASAGGRWLIYTQAVGDPLGSTAGNTFNGLAAKSFYGAPYDFAASGFTVGVNNGNRFVYAYQPTLTFTPDSRIVTYTGAIPTTSATVTGLISGDLITDAALGPLVITGATSKAAGTYSLAVDVSGLTSDLNYAFAAGAPGTLRIDPKALSGVLAATSKTYDGTALASGSIDLTGVVAGDTVGASGAYAFSDKTAASGKTVTASGVALTGADAGNYTLAPVATTQADILKKGLTGALVADSKTYDGTALASGSIGLSGVVAGDTVAVSGAYAFADKTAATGKTVTASGVALTGADAGNYTLAPVGTSSADILKRSLTGALVAHGKTYDGTTTATGTIGLTGLVAGDAISVSGTYAFVDRNAGIGKTVIVSGATLTGLDAANYDLGGVSNGLADILRRPVTVAADSAFKPFGQVDPTLTYRVTVGGLVAGDAFAGGLGRGLGEAPGNYGITLGTLGLSTNYDLTFTGATFTIQPLPSKEQDGSMTLKHMTQSPDFTLDWDPEPNLTTQGPACPGEACPPPVAATSGGGKMVAALR